MNFLKKMVVIMLVMALTIIMCNNEAFAATKSRSEVRNGYIYRYSVTTSKANRKKKVVPNTNTVKNKYADISITVTSSKSWTVTAEGTVGAEYAGMTAELSLSSSVSGGIEAGRTFNIKSNAPNGTYQVVTYFPGEKVVTKTTKEKNGNGNIGIMSEGSLSKKPPEIIKTNTINYMPKKLKGGPVAEAVLVK